MIKRDETLEDLQFDGLKIIQKTSGYRFTTDAVLLANFVHGAKDKKVLEIGTGSGVIAILITAKQSPKQVVGVEIQPEVYDMASRSVELNGLQDVIKLKNLDAKQLGVDYNESFDIVVSNPPYRKVGSGMTQKQDDLCISRHEVALTLEELFGIAKRTLKFGGSFYLVHQIERLGEAFSLGGKYGLEPKELCPILPRQNQPANLFLARFVKGGKTGLKWVNPIVVFDEEGNYSVTVKQLYGDSFEVKK